jgi:hypothetical protein
MPDVYSSSNSRFGNNQFFYAFTLPDLTSAPPARPEVVGANPFNDPRGMKRGHNGEDGEGDGKRMRGDYVCKICNQPGVSRIFNIQVDIDLGIDQR